MGDLFTAADVSIFSHTLHVLDLLREFYNISPLVVSAISERVAKGKMKRGIENVYLLKVYYVFLIIMETSTCTSIWDLRKQPMNCLYKGANKIYTFSY